MAPSSETNRLGGVEETYADIDWDKLGFSLTTTDYMYVMKCKTGDKFSEGSVIPYGNIEISPASGVINYGQGSFEGLKVYRRLDGKLMLFRPWENALRMQHGAERLLMSAPSTEQFIEAVKQTALANKRWVPPYGKGSMYLRPLLFGSGALIGLGPAPEYTFLVYACPTGNYFKSNEALNLLIETRVNRSAPGGTGGVKSITNYSPVFESVKQAKANGFSDVLFLDAPTGKYVEELSAANVFIMKGDEISTPETEGNILPGITRKSIVELAQDLGYKVKERRVPVEDVLDADEVFVTGTAAVVAQVGSITYQEKRVEYKTGEETAACKLRAMLTGIQTGIVEDTKGWTYQIN